ncbi:MAG: copper amine oxidase N-terminal domain-containing protein [Syntrophomonas sp.]
MKARYLILSMLVFMLIMSGTAAAENLPQPDKGSAPMTAQLDNLVTAGTITQEQENAVLEALKPDTNAPKPDEKGKTTEIKQDPSQTLNTKLSSLVSSGIITQTQLDSILQAIKPPTGGQGNPPGNETQKVPVSSETKANNNLAGNIVLKVGSSKMTVKGTEKDIDPGYNTAPLIVNKSTFIPIRAVIESLGGKVDWDAENQKTTIALDNITVALQIGNTSATVNGVAKKLESLPFIAQSGRVMLPVRFVTENLGHSVNWDEASKSIIIN